MSDQTDPAVRARKRRNLRRRVYFYGGFALALWAFWVWQPWEFDFIPRGQPKKNPPTDPDSAILFSPKAKVLVVTAHPDDDEFYIAGTLLTLSQSGAQIYSIVCTDGDKGYYPFEDWQRNRRVRRQEQMEASARYHVKEVLFFAHPDGRLRADEILIQHIQEEIERIRPDYVLCFDGAYPPRMSHQDHRRSGDAAEAAARRSGKTIWLLRFFTASPNFVVDITRQWSDKREMLAIHKSQFHDDRLMMIRNMVEDMASKDGERIGVPYGEGFRCEKLR